MHNQFRSFLLLLARLVVGYPATWLLAMSSGQLLAEFRGTPRHHCQSLLCWLVHNPNRQRAAYVALRNSELTLLGLAVTVTAFILTLWLLPI
jgi:hypothetical protein